MKTFDQEKQEFEQKASAFADAAFPVSINLQFQSKQNMRYSITSKGMSKREYFASIAIQGILANETIKNGAYQDTPAAHADRAVQCADALISKLGI